VEVDGFGIYGTYFHYSMVAFMFFSALLIFCVMWKKGKVIFDETPKYSLFEEE